MRGVRRPRPAVLSDAELFDRGFNLTFEERVRRDRIKSEKRAAKRLPMTRAWAPAAKPKRRNWSP